MERLIVSIEAEPTEAPAELETFFVRRGWKRVDNLRWESAFLDRGAAAKQVDRDLEEADTVFNDLRVRVATRRTAIDAPMRPAE